jgi:hypothetical protein
MKMLLLALSLASTSVLAQETISNGGMLPGDPQVIMVARVPLGSGIPSPGATGGYSEALPVSDGLYHVPGYLPYESTSASLWPRVVTVQCRQTADTWYCSGYHVDGILGRGEDVYVRPEFQRVVAPVKPVSDPIIIPSLPARPFVRPYIKPYISPRLAPKKICN